MTTATIAELLNPAALAVPAVWSLFERLYPEGRPLMPAGAEALRMEIADDIEGNHAVLFLAYEGTKPVGLIHIRLPSGPWDPEPFCVGWVNKGAKATGRALTDRGVEFLREHGYSSFRAINSTDKADSIWARSFRRVTKPGVRVGSIMRFEFK